jgi:hypothetical protein
MTFFIDFLSIFIDFLSIFYQFFSIFGHFSASEKKTSKKREKNSKISKNGCPKRMNRTSLRRPAKKGQKKGQKWSFFSIPVNRGFQFLAENP